MTPRGPAAARAAGHAPKEPTMNLGLPEILVVLALALLVFRPRRLPELGKSLGQGIREFRKSTQGLRDDLEATLKDDPAKP